MFKNNVKQDFPPSTPYDVNYYCDEFIQRFANQGYKSELIYKHIKTVNAEERNFEKNPLLFNFIQILTNIKTFARNDWVFYQ